MKDLCVFGPLIVVFKKFSILFPVGTQQINFKKSFHPYDNVFFLDVVMISEYKKKTTRYHLPLNIVKTF